MKLALLLLLSVVSGFGADSFRLTEKLSDAIVVTNGLPVLKTSASATVQASITLSNFSSLKFTTNTPCRLLIGDLILEFAQPDAVTANRITLFQRDQTGARVTGGQIVLTRTGNQLGIAATLNDLKASRIIAGLLQTSTGTEIGTAPFQVQIGSLLKERSFQFKATKTIGQKSQNGQVFSLRNYNIAGEFDFTKPVLTVSPRPADRISAATILLTGKATDTFGISSVKVSINGTPEANAQFQMESGQWSYTASLQPGTNLVIAKARDLAGNESLASSLKITRVVLAPLNLSWQAGGAVKGAANNQLLEIGKEYTVTATANADFAFNGWTGSVTNPNSTLRFRMASNTILTASFTPARFNGLFLPPVSFLDSASASNSGFFTLTRAASGVGSGKLIFQGGSLPFSGLVFSNGQSKFAVPRPGKSPLMVTADLLSDEIGFFIEGLVTDGIFSAQLGADPASVAAVPDGKFTFAIKVGATNFNPVVLPLSSGAGAGTANKGVATFTGTLPDGTSISTSIPMSSWPLSSSAFGPVYISLQNGKGLFAGWAEFSAGAILSNSPLVWVKAPNAAESLYPTGFRAKATFAGAPYIAPSGGANALAWKYGDMVFSYGNIATPNPVLQKTATINSTSIAGSDASLNARLTVNNASGLVSGSFTHPVSLRVTKINAVVIQAPQSSSGSAIRGNFQGLNEAGDFRISKSANQNPNPNPNPNPTPIGKGKLSASVQCNGWSIAVSGEDFSSTQRSSSMTYDSVGRRKTESGTITTTNTGRIYSYSITYSYNSFGCISSMRLTMSGGLLNPSSQTITAYP